MQNIAKISEQFSDVNDVKKALKSLQSIKCRLKKQKARADYSVEMSKVLQQEQLLKEVRQFLEPKELTVTTMSVEQIAKLDYAETVRAIKSIQSKKCLNKFQPDGPEYQSACAIELLLIAHRKTVVEIPVEQVRKSDIINLIEDLQNLSDKDKLKILEDRLQQLLK
jgi:hypothetical protein